MQGAIAVPDLAMESCLAAESDTAVEVHDAAAVAAAATAVPPIFGFGAFGEIGTKQPSAMLAAAAEQTQMTDLAVTGKAVSVPLACGAASMKAVGW